MDKKLHKQEKEGIIISDKTDKTVVVLVESFKKHPIYKKRYISSKHFKAHDEKKQFKVGDKVKIEETRPLSKDKRWQVVGKIRIATNENSNKSE